jgi:hypothetical protein
MEFSFRQRSQHVQLSKPNGALTKFQPSGLIQQAATVAAPTVVAISFAATTSSHDPYPIYKDNAPCGGWRDVHNCSVRKTIQLVLRQN